MIFDHGYSPMVMEAKSTSAASHLKTFKRSHSYFQCQKIAICNDKIRLGYWSKIDNHHGCVGECQIGLSTISYGILLRCILRITTCLTHHIWPNGGQTQRPSKFPRFTCKIEQVQKTAEICYKSIQERYFYHVLSRWWWYDFCL